MAVLGIRLEFGTVLVALRNSMTAIMLLGAAIVVLASQPTVTSGDSLARTSQTGTPSVLVSYVTPSVIHRVRINSPVPVTATFSEPVSGFAVEDISLVNGLASNFVGSDGDAVYTFHVTPNAIGEVTVDIADGVAEDVNRNGNTAARQFLLGIPYDDNSDSVISRDEAITAITDYLFGGLITRDETVAVIALYVFPPTPDLVAGAPTVSDSSPTAGASFTLSATVSNQGNGRSDSTTLRYYRSTGATITTSDTGVGTDSVSGLAASGISSQSISLLAPSIPGTYYYGSCVDAVAGESDTTNNCSSSVTVEVEEPAPTPDLVALLAVRDRSVETGGTLTILIGVYNEGDGASVATTVRYYRSTDATITTTDTLLGTEAVPALRPNLASSDSFQKGYTRTAPSTAGTYYYGSCVDAVAGETNTTNNCSSAVTVTVGAATSMA